MLPQLLLLAIVHVLFLQQTVIVSSLRLEGVLHRIVMVLQAIHGLNLRLVSPRSHLGTSLLPGLYDVFFIKFWCIGSLGLCIHQDRLHLLVVELQHGVLVDLLCSSDACCWPCSSLPAVGFALLMPAVGFALVMGPWVPTLAVFFMGSRVPIPGCLFMGSRVPIPGCFLHGFSGPNPWLFVHG